MTDTVFSDVDISGLLRARDFAAAHQCLSEVHQAYKASPGFETNDGLWHAINSINGIDRDQNVRIAVLEEWLAQAPDDPYANLCLADQIYGVAGGHRGCDLADTVSDEDWQAIHHYCEQAAELAEKSIALGGPAGYAINLLMWQEQVIGSQHRAEQLLNRAIELDPTWLGCWLHMLSIKDPRWGGSDPEMRAILKLAEQYFDHPRMLDDLHGKFAIALGGYRFRFEDDHERALALLLPAWKLNPKDFRAAAIREETAWAYQGLQDYEKAAEAWLAAAEKYPCGEYFRQAAWCFREKLDAPEKTLECYEKAADYEDDDAAWCIYFLALAYRDRELGVERDMPKARAYFEKLIGMGENISDDSLLAWAYDGLASTYLIDDAWRDVPQAIAWYEKSVALGLPDSMRSMGWVYADPRYAYENPELATEWFKRAGEAGDDQGFRLYVHRVVDEIGIKADVQTKMDLLRQAAERGDPSALRRLAGLELQHGEARQAEMLLWQAVQEDDDLMDSRAAFALAYGLANGWFGAKDEGRAVEVLKEAIRKQRRSGRPCYVLLMLLSSLTYPLFAKDWAAIQELRGVLEECQAECSDGDQVVAADARRQLAALPASWLGTKMGGHAAKGVPQPSIPANIWNK